MSGLRKISDHERVIVSDLNYCIPLTELYTSGRTMIALHLKRWVSNNENTN